MVILMSREQGEKLYFHENGIGTTGGGVNCGKGLIVSF